MPINNAPDYEKLPIGTPVNPERYSANLLTHICTEIPSGVILLHVAKVKDATGQLSFGITGKSSIHP